MNAKRWGSALEGYLFVAPFLALAAVFMVYPIIRGFRNSLFDYRFGGSLFVGMSNYAEVFTNDLYLLAIKNSLIIVATVVPLLIVCGLLIAGSIFDKSFRYMSAVRTMLYIPVIASMVVMTMIWKFLLDSQSGLARYGFDLLGMKPVNLLGDARWTMLVVILILFTMQIGQSVVLYTASMIGIPKELIEALQMDGGKRHHLFRYVLLPLTKPTTLFIFVTETAAMLRVFVVIQLLTHGGPNSGSTTMMFLLYKKGFTYGDFGVASALGVVMFLLTLLLVLLQFVTRMRTRGEGH